MIKKIKKFIYEKNLDGYIIPKNDTYFTEYSRTNNLSKVTNFTGSAGFCIILKKINYLFIDGRYTIQAKKEAGKNFKIFEIPNILPKDLLILKNYKIGFNPKLFTKMLLKKYFYKNTILVPVEFDFKNEPDKYFNKIFQLTNKVCGESSTTKFHKIKQYMREKKIKYLFVSASENVNWLLNIRGKDLPNSPLVNCKLIMPLNGKPHLFINSNKIPNLIKKKFENINICDDNNFFEIINKLKNGSFCIDKNTCSIFEECLINSKFRIKHEIDPIYYLKSIKNKTEIKNTQDAHILDGVALTKFLYWFKTNKKTISEKKIEVKLEKFRKRSKKYLYPSFDTIAGSGPNGAIIHYKSNNKTNRKLKKNDLLLLDSGGQYKWGTTDVTRTVCTRNVRSEIKNNFTRVLKGHIAVINCDLNKNYSGYLIDKLARKPLRDVGLDYSHGTGHGVGFFSNVHEGPQSITKYNNVKLENGMILSNEPGYYQKNKYGIRIENLIYVKKFKKKIGFENLTYVPIDVDIINFKMLNSIEKKYLFDYHLSVYSKLSKFLNKYEKKWLINLIK